MVKPAPKIDDRTATIIAEQVQTLLGVYAPEWKEFDTDPATGQRKPQGISAGIIGVFSRFCEIVIQRIDRVPDKNLLAFLNLLGASRLPPQPARVPLTFSLVKGSTVDAIVPAGTQVAAPPGEGEKEPIIFETERELVVTSVQFASIFVSDPQQDTWSDRTSWLTPSNPIESFVFRGDRPIEHSLYLACDELLTLPIPKTVTFTIQSSPVNPLANLPLIWSYSDGKDWQVLPVNSSIDREWQVSIANCPIPVPRSIEGIAASWIKVQLNQPLPAGLSPLPSIQSIQASIRVERSDLLPDLAFNNTIPLDLTKDFYPFGETPHLNDAFYFASQEIFSKVGAIVTVNITLNDTVPVNPTGNIQVAWEAWDGSAWQPLSVNSSNSASKFLQTGSVTFTRPNSMGLREENGKKNYWIRVRIVGGNYGQETIPGQSSTFTTLTQTSQNINNKGLLTVNSVRGFMPNDRIQIAAGTNTQEIREIESVNLSNNSLTLKTALQNTHPVGTGVWLANTAVVSPLSPPFVKSLKLSYTYDTSGSKKPLSACQSYNNFTYENCTNSTSFFPFKSSGETKQALYLGFTLPQNRSDFPDRPFSLFVRLADLKDGGKSVPLEPSHSRQVGATGKTVSHQLSVTNDTSQSVTWMMMVLGNTWMANVSSSITLGAYETKSLEVKITIPESPNQQKRDRAFLRLYHPADNPTLIYSTILDTFIGETLPPSDRVQLSWQYWNGQAWSKFTIEEDGTENFTRSGLIRFLVPADFHPKTEFGQSERYWLRVQKLQGEYAVEPQVQWLALNTTFAKQSITISNEILGSSDGTENQKFRTTRSPILDGQTLQVREPEMPSVAERENLQKIYGNNAIVVDRDAAGNAQKIWVTWQEVPDFYASGRRDRHYTLNHLTGEIQFGNGLNGMSPPTGIGNIRMTRYQTGGGKIGNRNANTIIQLKTTIPYVEKVTNLEPAAGGADAETLDSLKERMPRTIRHGGRAVTLEDYEDLAMLASPEVARAKCVTLRNLTPSSEGEDFSEYRQVVPGTTSIIIVPRSQENKPLPSLELLDRVRNAFNTNSTLTAKVSVVSPLYICVSVTAEIALISLDGASAVEQAVEQKLTQFLHPLTGGLDGNGWDFGREPYKSDFYRQIESVSGVDHVRSLRIGLTVNGEENDEQNATQVEAIRQTGLFLVHSGKHTIDLVFEES
jgi:uncharacterized phage protein gp47/JayE